MTLWFLPLKPVDLSLNALYSQTPQAVGAEDHKFYRSRPYSCTRPSSCLHQWLGTRSVTFGHLEQRHKIEQTVCLFACLWLWVFCFVLVLCCFVLIFLSKTKECIPWLMERNITLWMSFSGHSCEPHISSRLCL